jgi:hypothetical protein
MKVVRIAWVSAAAAALIALGGQRASAQQYYGYASQQSPAPSPQAAIPCQPCQTCQGCVPTIPPPCQPLKCGCDVVYCPPTTCQPGATCVPPIPFYAPPGCQAACLVYDECAPQKPVQWVTIYRNHYVPIKIVKTPAQVDVQPISIQVNERIVHFLCDCAPGTANCPHVPSGTPQTGGTPQTTATPQPASGPAVETANANAQPAPSASLAAQVNPAASPAGEKNAQGPAKQWIWLSNENCYGYGYINEQGYAIVDPATKTTTPTVASAK